MKRVSESLEYLDFLSNHFAFRDWDYTRVSHIKDIRYKREHDVRNQYKYRFRKALKFLFLGDKWWPFGYTMRDRFSMFVYFLKRETNTPDGILDGGNIITFWEETGEYLNMMQPTVGALLVNFLKEEPEHPHAKLIQAELDRIHKRWKKRIKDGEVTGKIE